MEVAMEMEMEMEKNHEYPDGFDSYIERNIISSNKKRKFLPELSVSPQPKHKCCGRGITSRCGSSQKKNFSILDLPPKIYQKSDKEEWTITSGDSVRDSNSFAIESNSVVSSFESKSEPEITMAYSYGQSSMSFADSENDSIQMEASKEEVKYISGSEEHDSFHACNAFSEYQNIEDRLLEIGSPTDYGFSEYGDEKIEHSEGNELEDTLYLDRINSNTYVLSSGRWSVGREAQSSSRKPTIDQEFEQYFSSLMLQRWPCIVN